MDSLDFSEDEIQEQLAILGYKNIAKHRLQEFKRDLDELILHGKWQTRLNQLNSSSCHTAASQLSRPAYTKEKVSQCCIQSLDDGFTLHAGKVDLDRQVITTCQTRNHGWRQGHADSYAQHSVTTMLRPPPGAPAGLQVELEPEDPQHPPYADSHRSIPYTQRTRFIKRKVLRKHKGESLVCDESMYSEETDAASLLEERMEKLDLSKPPQLDDDDDDDDVTFQSNSQSSKNDRVSLSAFESYIRRMIRTDADLRPKPKSFIRPALAQQTLKKTDPVAKYFQYKQFWEMFKLPGETERRALRRQIKEQLVYQPPAPKPRRVYLPNTYVVPTEKKRSALRWEVRNDLANGLLPHKLTYRF